MNTPIKQRNPNPLTQAQVVAYISGAAVEYTADHDITVSEYGKRIVHGFAATAEHTFTLPTLTSLNDGIIYTIINKSYYKLTVDCESSDDHVWQCSLGVEMPDIWTSITVQGNLASNCWDIIHKAGGRVIVQGVVLHENMDTLTLNQTGANTVCNVIDSTRGKIGLAYGSLYATESLSNTQFPPSCFVLNGSTDYLIYNDSPDWDIFGTTTGVKVVAGWVYISADGSTHCLVANREDANNYWEIYKASSNVLGIFYISDSSVQVNLILGSVAAGGWKHIALVIYGVSVGAYVNGIQVSHTSSWDADTFSGSLYLGSVDGSSEFLAGRMQDWHIAYNDTLGLSGAPDSGLNSRYTKPEAPMNLVM